MSINPLSSQLPGMQLANSAPARKGGASSFDALLDTLRPEQGTSQPKQDLAAAQLIQLEMMQNSLALAGDTAPAENFGVSRLSSLLPGLLQNAHSSSSRVAIGSPSLLPAETLQGLTPSPELVPSQGNGEITRTASRYLGTPYRFGGNGPSGIDCSSFVQQVFREHQVELPRTAREQSTVGQDVPVSELKEGDLLFFQTYASYPSHVGIYIGNGKMIHASSGKGEVTVSNMNSDYYRSRFIGAKRVA